MASTGQHKVFHQGIRDFLIEIGVDPTREHIEEAKKIFKRYLEVRSVASLSDAQYSRVISAVFMLMAREFSVEVPRFQAEKSMTELLKEFNHDERRMEE